jgi:hypothetical protein
MIFLEFIKYFIPFNSFEVLILFFNFENSKELILILVEIIFLNII